MNSTEPAPEQTFFDDPALDIAVAMIMTLATELQVTRDRLRSLEVLLEKQGVLAADALDGYEPDEEESKRLGSDREAFVASLFEAIKRRQASKGAADDLMEQVG